MGYFEGLDLDAFWDDSDYALSAYDSGPFDQAEIDRLEQELGYKLPASYIELMRSRNGGIPVPCLFPTGTGEYDYVAIAGIPGIGHEKDFSLGGYLGSRFMIEEWDYPDIGIGICDCPSAGHDMVFLDYRECGPQGEPKVVHIDNEFDNAITPLADSFEEFITGLVTEEAFKEMVERANTPAHLLRDPQLKALWKAMRGRHTVRSFLPTPLPADVVAQLRACIDELNAQLGIDMRLVLDSGDAFGPLLKATLAKHARNYVVLAGREDTPDLQERLGYASGWLMLRAQVLGLNSWWIGGTYKREGAMKAAGVQDEAIIGIVVVGYGANQGKPHKSKTAAEVSDWDGTPGIENAPAWFANGVEAALLAPTAINRQAFQLSGTGDQVHASYYGGSNIAGGTFSSADLGLVKQHFELGAGTENFHWV